MSKAHRASLSLDDIQRLEAFRLTLPRYRQHERHNLLAYRWDIVVAQFLLKQTPRVRGSLDVAEAAQRLSFHFSSADLQQQGLEPDHYTAFYSVFVEDAMHDRVNLKRPLLLVEVQSHMHSPVRTLLMDGYHRVYKAFHQGVRYLETYTLTPQEERLCRY